MKRNLQALKNDTNHSHFHNRTSIKIMIADKLKMRCISFLVDPRKKNKESTMLILKYKQGK